MRSPFRLFLVAALAVPGIPLAIHAQDSTTAQKRAAALVMDHTFSSPGGEPVRVFLAKDVEYRAYIDNAGKMTLTVKPLEPGATPPPTLMPLVNGTDASGEAIWTVKPKADAVYVFSSDGGDPASPVRLRLVAQIPKKKP